MPLRTMAMIGAYGAREQEGLGQAMMGAGREATDIISQQMATANEAATKNYDAQLQSKITDLLHDPQNGYLFQQGGNAVNGLAAAQKALSGLPDAVIGDEQNPRVRQMFDQVAQQRLQAASSAMLVHAGQQTQKYDLDASTARAGAAQQSAIMSYNPMPDADNTIYNQALATQRAELNSQADHMGLAGDARTAYLQEGMGKTATGVVSHLLENNQTKAAQAYFADIRGDLPAAVGDKINSVLQGAADKDDALSTYLSSKDKHGTDIGAIEKDLDQQFKDGSISADVHDMALQKAKADYSLAREQETQYDKNLLGQVWAFKQQNPNASVADLPANIVGALRANGHLAVSATSIMQQSDSMDDSKTFADLMRMSAEDPSAFVKMDMASMSGALTGQHFNHLVNLQTSMNSGDLKAADVAKVQASAVRDQMAAIKASGLNPAAKPGTDQATELDKFESSLHDAIIAENQTRQQSKKPPLNRDEAGQLVAGLAKDQALAGTGLWGIMQTRGPSYKLVDQIDSNERQQIAGTLQSAGLAPTPTNIVDYYNRKHATK